MMVVSMIKVDLDKVREIARSKGFTDIQAEILAQLYYLNPLWVYDYRVKQILGIAEGYGIRLHVRTSRVINIDIIIDILYDEAKDLYDVKAFLVSMSKNEINIKEIAEYSDVFFEDLDTVIKQIINK
jgi:hypothetical protein